MPDENQIPKSMMISKKIAVSILLAAVISVVITSPSSADQSSTSSSSSNEFHDSQGRTPTDFMLAREHEAQIRHEAYMINGSGQSTEASDKHSDLDKDGQTIALKDQFMQFIPLLLIISAIVLLTHTKKKNTAEKLATIDSRLKSKRSEVIVVTSSSVPTKQISNVLGAVTGVSTTQASTKVQFEMAEKEAMLALIENAQAIGANAIVDLKLTTGSYQQQGSQWQVSQSIYSGTAVVVS